MRSIATRIQRASSNIKGKTKIDRSVRIKNIKQDEEDTRTYYCSCCGKMYVRQVGNFSPSKSPIFAGNNGHVTVCRTCTDKYFIQLTDFFSGNEEKAIERICSIYDWYYDESAVIATSRRKTNTSRISVYPSKLNLAQTANLGDTYLDYIASKFSNEIDSFEKLDELNQTEKTSLSERTVKRWGLGYTPEEYDFLNLHYKTLKEKIPTADVVVDTLVKDLCVIKVQQMRMLQAQDVDKYSKLTDLYQKTLLTANMKPVSTKDVANNAQMDGIGLWTKEIEKYTPAEFFKDKSIYKDYDGLGEYFKRFIVRPFKNLLTGSKDMDLEFSVGQIQPGDDLDASP